jgi:hypothetical protein
VQQHSVYPVALWALEVVALHLGPACLGSQALLMKQGRLIHLRQQEVTQIKQFE